MTLGSPSLKLANASPTDGSITSMASPFPSASVPPTTPVSDVDSPRRSSASVALVLVRADCMQLGYECVDESVKGRAGASAQALEVHGLPIAGTPRLGDRRRHGRAS